MAWGLGEERARSERPRWPLIVLLTVVGGLLGMPFATSPAAGAVANVIPADASGDPIDELRADEALFAYATVDLLGGKVCIVNATVQSADDASCARPAWGTPNDVSGLGLTFLPIQPPILYVGRWRLLGHGDEGGRVLSQPFTVLPCEHSCQPELALATLADWKAAAQASADALGYGCGDSGLKEVLDAVSAAKEGVAAVLAARTALVDQLSLVRRTTRLKAVAPVASSTLVSASSTLVSVGTGFVSMPLPIFQNNEERAKALLKLLTCNLQLMYEDIVLDPPDPAYREVASAALLDQPEMPGVSDTATALIDALARQYGYGRAQLHAVERYQGAVADGQQAFVHAQALAIARHGSALVDSQREAVDLLRAYADEASADPVLAGATVPDQATLDGLKSLYERVKTSGFTAAELAGFSAAGYSADEVAQLRAGFEVDLSVVEPGRPYPQALAAVADELEAAIPAFDRLAREAEGVAMSVNPEPEASFTCTQVASRTLRCEATAVPLDLDEWRYEWTAEGEVVGHEKVMEHTFGPAASEFAIKLTVSDPYRSSSISLPNLGSVGCCVPVARFSIRPSKVEAGQPFQLADLSTDDGTITSWRWFIPGLPTLNEQHPTVTIDTPGPHVVVLEVTDDGGRFGQTTATVWVHPPDGQPTRGECPASPNGHLDSEGNEFVFAFPDTDYANSAGPWVTLHITGPTATTGYVEVPALGHSEDFTVTPGGATVLQLPSNRVSAGGVLNDTVDHVVPVGVRVCTVEPVSVYGLTQKPHATDAFQGIPVDALGTEHLVMAYPDTLPLFPYGGSSFTVVAVEDDTNVRVTPTAATTGHPAGEPFTIALDRFDVYTLVSPADGSDLTGSRIVADRPVALMGSNRCANVPAGITACDHLVEQLPPTSTWGSEFVVPSLAARTGGDVVRVLARDHATVVSVDGREPFRLDGGEHRDVELPSGESLHVSATAPLLVAQFAKGSEADGRQGDPFMALAVPVAQYRHSYTLDSVAHRSFPFDSWINVVAPDGSTCTDGDTPIGPLEPVVGSRWSVARHHTVEGPHVIDCRGAEFGVLTYGWEFFESYGYPGGFDLGPIAPPPAALETAVGYIGPAEIQYSDTLSVGVGLFDISPGRHAPIGGRMLTVDVGASGPADIGPTAAEGTATRLVTVDEPAGSLPIVVGFAGGGGYRPASGTATIDVLREDCTLGGSGTGLVGGLVLQAELGELDSSLGNRSGKEIAFVVDNGPAIVAVTDSSGTASMQMVAAPGPHTVEARFAGDDRYTACETAAFEVTAGAAAAQLTVVKHVVNDNGGIAAAADFTVAVAATNPSPASFPGVEAPGTTVTLDAGAYNVTETGPSGYSASFSAECNGSIAVGETRTCTVTNDDIAPTLTVNKIVVTNQPPDPGRFNLTVDGSTAGTGGNVGNGGTTGAVPVNAGAHTVGETAVAGTALSDYVTVISGACAANGAVMLALAQNKVCTITNTRKATARVVKTENGQAPSVQYTFRLSGGLDAVSITRTTGVNDSPLGSGNLDFGTLKPGSYTLCELMVPAGTTSTLQMFPGAITNMTTGDVCGPIVLGPGDTAVFTVDNAHPLGGQRTIGYWKNWNTCAGSNGNQVRNAAKTGHALVDQLLPIVLVPASGAYGGLTVTTCAKAVEILTTSSSKYAEHALAAQLLAALLNKAVAGGQACTAANQAIMQAQSLLQQIAWNGGKFTTKVGDKHSLRSAFLSTASHLDKYNNQLLC